MRRSTPASGRSQDAPMDRLDRAGPLPRDEAVSPVLATILMIAITVVLAGVLLVIVKGFPGTSDQAPTVQFLRDDTNGQLVVIQAFRPIDLSQVEVQTSDDTRFALDADADLSSTPIPADVFVPFAASPGTLMAGGDTFDFCRDGGPGKTDFSIRVMDPKPILVYRNTFTNLRGCS